MSMPRCCCCCCLLQVAFADKVLLNKVDLVDEREKRAIVSAIRVGGRGGGGHAHTTCPGLL